MTRSRATILGKNPLRQMRPNGDSQTLAIGTGQLN
jgi:hypothetical protein